MNNIAATIANTLAAKILVLVDSLDEISGLGTCNRVFLASGVEKIIIRLNDDRDNREFQKENWCMTQAAANGVSVAKSLGYGQSGQWNYNIQSFAGAQNGDTVEDRTSLWHWLGQSAAKIHRVSVRGFGDILLDEEQGRFDGDWDRYLADNIASLKTGEYKQYANLSDRFEKLAASNLKFGLCHGDLKPANTVLDGDRKTVIDWGCAHAHIVPHYDFIELLRDHEWESVEVKGFATGYGLSNLDSLRAEIESVLLLCAFDVIRWAKDRAPEQFETKLAEFQNFAERFAVI